MLISQQQKAYRKTSRERRYWLVKFVNDQKRHWRNWVKTRLWLILHIGLTLVLAGCASETLQLPRFEEAERSQESVTYPVEYNVLCEIPLDQIWSVDCWNRFAVFEEIAVDNRDLAILNAQIAEDSDRAYDHILAAAKSQQMVAQIREEMLQEAHRQAFLDNLYHRVIILFGVLAAVW